MAAKAKATKRALEEANGVSLKNGSHANDKSKRLKSSSQRAVIPQSLLEALYSPSNTLKLWHVARKSLGSTTPPVLYPETTAKDGTYIYRNLDFWTSGFFPGSLYLLLERQLKYRFSITTQPSLPTLHPLQLKHLSEWWTANLHQNATKRDTHDVGFMIAPWALKAWSLHRDPQAYSSLILAAHSLASRFDEKVQSLRSWDIVHTKVYSYTDPSKDFLVIIDNMLNLELLFWVANETGDQSLYEKAIAHARTTAKYHIRDDKSTAHVVNYDTETGTPKAIFTHQGYSNDSCWSRGQAWGILGFMQTYQWTKESEFLTTARELADYFLSRLPGDRVPYWDFDAPVNERTPRDTSAGMVAACGLVMLYQELKDGDEGAARHYLDAALGILEGTVRGYMTPDVGEFGVDLTGTDLETCPETEPLKQPGTLIVTTRKDTNGVSGNTNGNASRAVKVPETILNGATVCNYEHASRRWADHGLVYADYYFLLLGNMLLEMGLVSQV
ncbi:Six-hairpin glycosidase-like protein [Aspergillus karnatakaensis]|uniref:glycoside hydrolase family 88 protein n=1 Tax=Aspergillus karnatakaensis TaxID=1810916 RepID=UPI003CCCA4CB